MLVGAAVSKKQAINQLTIEKGNLPPYFKEDQSIILAISKDLKYDKYLHKGFGKYLGKYEIISQEELKKSKYRDKDKYRYIFDFDPIIITTSYTDGSSSESMRKRFFIYDRVEEKKYGPAKQSSFYSKTIQAYIINLNKIIEN